MQAQQLRPSRSPSLRKLSLGEGVLLAVNVFVAFHFAQIFWAELIPWSRAVPREALNLWFNALMLPLYFCQFAFPTLTSIFLARRRPRLAIASLCLAALASLCLLTYLFAWVMKGSHLRHIAVPGLLLLVYCASAWFLHKTHEE